MQTACQAYAAALTQICFYVLTVCNSMQYVVQANNCGKYAESICRNMSLLCLYHVKSKQNLNICITTFIYICAIMIRMCNNMTPICTLFFTISRIKHNFAFNEYNIKIHAASNWLSMLHTISKYMQKVCTQTPYTCNTHAINMHIIFELYAKILYIQNVLDYVLIYKVYADICRHVHIVHRNMRMCVLYADICIT